MPSSCFPLTCLSFLHHPRPFLIIKDISPPFSCFPFLHSALHPLPEATTPSCFILSFLTSSDGLIALSFPSSLGAFIPVFHRLLPFLLGPSSILFPSRLLRSARGLSSFAHLTFSNHFPCCDLSFPHNRPSTGRMFPTCR